MGTYKVYPAMRYVHVAIVSAYRAVSPEEFPIALVLSSVVRPIIHPISPCGFIRITNAACNGACMLGCISKWQKLTGKITPSPPAQRQLCSH